jgi:LysR family transcriptional regulator, regulator for metE and metH
MKETHEPDGPPCALEVRHLRLVRAIAGEGSVTRAATKLHLSQSAVSHQLLDLERDLGARIFDRVGKRMVVTPSGTKLLSGAERVLGDLAALERELHDLRGDARVPLRVTTSCYTSYHWLPRALAKFAASHPRIDLDIVLEATRRATAALAADEVDLAIVTDPPHDPSWASTPIVSGELVAVLSPKHEVFSRKRGRADPMLKWGDLRGTMLLVHDIGESLHAKLEFAVRESWLRESGERLGSPFTLQKIPLTEALVELARAGAGVGIVDRWTVEPYLGRDLVILPLLPRAPRTFHAVWRKANPRGLPIEELIQLIRHAVGPRLGSKPAGSGRVPNTAPRTEVRGSKIKVSPQSKPASQALSVLPLARGSREPRKPRFRAGL